MTRVAFAHKHTTAVPTRNATVNPPEIGNPVPNLDWIKLMTSQVHSMSRGSTMSMFWVQLEIYKRRRIAGYDDTMMQTEKKRV